MNIRVGSILDVALIAAIDEDDNSYIITSAYMREQSKTFHIIAEGEAYSMYERLHPGDKALVHYNGRLKGREAMEAFSLTSKKYFADNPEVSYLLSISKEGNRRLRMLGRKMKGIEEIGLVKDGREESEYLFAFHKREVL